MSTQEEIDNIFEKWEEYIPQPIYETVEKPPEYTPIPKNAGPKPITLEEYRKRQEKRREEIKQFRENQVSYTPKKRGGKKRKFQQACANLQRIINISKGKQKKNLINELKSLRQEGWKN